MIVLATDNMDCFAKTFNAARGSRRRLDNASRTLAEWAVICDDIICSSDVGALKAEDPVGFFGPWLAECGLDFSDALLIDDRADNCQAFELQGGSTILWKMGKNEVSEAEEAVGRWLDVRNTGGHSSDIEIQRIQESSPFPMMR
jgi:FMN phosphatase YigB (HAD superfamily)